MIDTTRPNRPRPRQRPRAHRGPRSARGSVPPRFLAYLVVAGGALAYSWGYGPHSFSLASAAPSKADIAGFWDAGTSSWKAAHKVSENATVRQPVLRSSIDVSTGADVRFDFHVTNASSKKLELNFPSGQTHDVVVTDATGHEIWRWSAGQMFTQSLRNQPLSPHETLSYTVRWRRATGAGRGPLLATATLTSQNYPLLSRTTFTLP